MLSKNQAQDNKSPENENKVKDLPDAVGNRNRNRRSRSNKGKQTDKPEENIEQYFNVQASENTHTPTVKTTKATGMQQLQQKLNQMRLDLYKRLTLKSRNNKVMS